MQFFWKTLILTESQTCNDMVQFIEIQSAHCTILYKELVKREKLLNALDFQITYIPSTKSIILDIAGIAGSPHFNPSRVLL